MLISRERYVIFIVILKSPDMALGSKSLYRQLKFNFFSAQKDHQKMSSDIILLLIFKHIFSWYL